ncbi:hypothetical protein E2C01_024361 [Portunus trituberculatus]|uniref:Uncharacterized protein n=1 Tax=Portunus trituberculatus TaxID=210409 RepID=A0A5B7EEI8_PORTR|nr:hypothetical protein [Portunus trituberculatus]
MPGIRGAAASRQAGASPPFRLSPHSGRKQPACSWRTNAHESSPKQVCIVSSPDVHAAADHSLLLLVSGAALPKDSLSY